MIFVHDPADFWLEVTLLSSLLFFYYYFFCPELFGCWDFDFGVSDILNLFATSFI